MPPWINLDHSESVTFALVTLLIEVITFIKWKFQ
jgi:hypothetical protein